MKSDDLVKTFADQHLNALNNLGVPDRVILGEDVKFWRFTGVVVKNVKRHESVLYPEIVPVYSEDNKIIGAASMFPKGNNLVASVTATYDLPERLDFENDVNFMLTYKASVDRWAAQITFTINNLFLCASNGEDPAYHISPWEEI